MADFYMFLTSDDCKSLHPQNRFDDFITELPSEHRFGSGGEWKVCLSELSLESDKITEMPESIIVQSDLVTDSYIQERRAPVLRVISSQSSGLSVSLYQSFYVGLAQYRVRSIRIRITNGRLGQLSAAKWDREGTVTSCTLHFTRT